MSKVIAGISPKKHYTPVSNSLIRNPEIDDATFRLICWMTSHTEGWEVNFISLQKALGYGRDKLRKILKTAENQNYLVRRKIRTEAGLFDFEYHIFKDTEDAIAFRESLPQAELTSDLFSGGGATRGVLTGGGSTGGGSARGGSARGGESTPVYIEEQYKENQKEEKHIQEAPLASPPAPPTQESVCENSEQVLTMKQPDLEEPTPQLSALLESYSTWGDPKTVLSALLLKKSESSQQTDNPSCRSTIAAGSFEKVEQPKNEPVVPSSEIVNPTSRPHLTCYTMHPTEKTEQAMQKTGLPSWMEKGGPNGWKAEFVESYRQYLSSTPRYAKELIRQATTGEAKNALTRLSKTASGTAEIQNHWDSFNELKERQQLTQSKQEHHSSDDTLALAIAADEERRRFEQQRHSWVPMPQTLAVDLKAKLQAAASSPKVPSNSRFSSFDLREVEAQLKQAIGA